MRRPHPQSHVTLQYRGHVTNRKCYICTFTRPMNLKLTRVVTLDEGLHLQSHVTQRTCGHVTKQKCLYLHIDKAHRSKMLTACWLGMRWPHPKNHAILRSYSHVTNQKRHIFSMTKPMATKLCKMGTYVEGMSRAKPNDSSVSKSRAIFPFTWLMISAIG